MANLILSATPTISNGAIYAAGDSIGGLITFTSGAVYGASSAVIRAITLTDLGKQSLLCDVMFFSDNPTATTFTDNAALDIADADITKILGVIKIATADYVAYADSSSATVTTAGLPVSCASTALYAHIIARGTPTYTSTTDLTLRVLLATD